MTKERTKKTHYNLRGREFPQTDKDHLKKNPTANIIVNGKRLNCSPLRFGNKARIYHFYSTLYWRF